jgi:chemotaxis protein CheD
MMAAVHPASEASASVYLHAGEIFASPTGCTIATIVGSCVAVCLFDPARRIGGANHYLLSESFGTSQTSPRFGSVAIPELVLRMLALGGRKSDLVAKIFGGASTTGVAGVSGSLGSKNVQIAKRILSAERIPIVAEDVGGERGRKIVFHTAEGHVWVRKL